MEQLYLSKTRTCLAFSISIIVHILLGMLVLRHSLQQQIYTLIPQPEDSEQYLAQTLISAGEQPPATVLFQDEAPSGNDIVSSSAGFQDQQAEQAAQPACEKTAPPLDAIPEQAPRDAHDTFAQPMPTPQAPETPAAAPAPEQQLTPASQRRTTNKQSVTLADVSRGFIKSVQQEAGHNQAARDMKQLALQIYATKIWNLIKNAFLAGDNGLHLPVAVSTHTQLVLTIDRTGALLEIHLEYPKHITALRSIERLIVSRAHRAGLFPPLPASIPGTSKTFSFPLFIEGQAGFHAYSLGYQ